MEFSQGCKSRSAILLGIEWTEDNDVLFVTNQGLELYSIHFDKKKVQKPTIYNLAMNWFVFSVSAQFPPWDCGVVGKVAIR